MFTSIKKKEESQKQEIFTVVDPSVQGLPDNNDSVSMSSLRYVNLPRIVLDNSPPILEYLNNEISALNQKISLLEKERDLVLKLLDVVEREKAE